MARPSKITEEQIAQGIEMRKQGHPWQHIAETLELTTGTVLYHCSPKRKAQVQAAIAKYHETNKEQIRLKQKGYALKQRD